ncbi:MAG: DNA polymerase III subunit epsilon [Sphingomonadales bacterium]|nr:DNA polymerase III subunit epsilon [Sphingomonadales bacterium]
MREIVFDTETTGFDPTQGDRIVEIGCVELINGIPTGSTFQTYVNPEREVPASATKIHGLTWKFLSDFPTFSVIADDFLAFIDDSKLVAHNAEFDFRFTNWELQNANHLPLPLSRMIDTLQMARMKFPGAQNSLDALCKRFAIDSFSRDLHGALLDSQILAEVYLELKGGRQSGMDLDVEKTTEVVAKATTAREKRSFPPTEEEAENHKKFVANLKNPIWLR